jgi:hypothetical protein
VGEQSRTLTCSSTVVIERIDLSPVSCFLLPDVANRHIKMICDVCKLMLEEHKNYHWKGTYGLSFEHHIDRLSLAQAAWRDCCICRTIDSKVSRLQPSRGSKTTSAERWDQEYFTRAALSYDSQLEVYRLDIMLNGSFNSERAGSFFSKTKW